jgi:hypothetical protein
MAIIKNVEIHHCRLDPKRPNASFNKEAPTWEVQIRTKDKAQKKEWEEAGLQPKLVEDKEGNTYYRVNLKKKSKKADGTPVAPVKLIDGKHQDVDPNSIGNGSIANIRLFQYEYDSAGTKKTASILMAVQLVKHLVYVPKPREDFDEVETETIDPPDHDDDAPPF